LDKKREKKNGKSPLELSVYYNDKTVCYALVFELTKPDFKKLQSKRLPADLADMKEKIAVIENNAGKLVKQITPFDFDKFYERFIHSTRFLYSEKERPKPI
jgi:hypothetical protein